MVPRAGGAALQGRAGGGQRLVLFGLEVFVGDTLGEPLALLALPLDGLVELRLVALAALALPVVLCRHARLLPDRLYP